MLGTVRSQKALSKMKVVLGLLARKFLILVSTFLEYSISATGKKTTLMGYLLHSSKRISYML